MLVFSIISYFNNVLIINFIVLCWYNFGFRLLLCNESRFTNQISLETLHSMVHVHNSDFSFFLINKCSLKRTLCILVLWLCLNFKANGLFIRVKTLSSTNNVDSRHKKERGPWEDPLHPVDRRFSETTLLNM